MNPNRERSLSDRWKNRDDDRLMQKAIKQMTHEKKAAFQQAAESSKENNDGK